MSNRSSSFQDSSSSSVKLDPIEVYSQPESGHPNYRDLQGHNLSEEIIAKLDGKTFVIDTAGLDIAEVLRYDHKQGSGKKQPPKELNFDAATEKKILDAATILSKDIDNKDAKDALELVLRKSGALTR